MIRMFIVYVDTSLIGNSPTTLTVVTSGAGFSRQWRIRITQIGCDSLARGKLMINCQVPIKHMTNKINKLVIALRTMSVIN